MRTGKAALLLSLVLTVVYGAAAQTPTVVSADPVPVHDFPVGDAPGAFGYGGDGPAGPGSMIFIDSRTMIVFDWVNSRWEWITTDGELVGLAEQGERAYWEMWFDPNGETIAIGRGGGADVFARTAEYEYERVYRITYPDTGYERREFLSGGFSFADDFLILEFMDPRRYVAVDLSDLENPVYYSAEDAPDAIRERQTVGEGLWVDDDGYLFLDDRLFTKNVATFYEYFSRDGANERSYTSLATSPAFVPRGLRLAGIDAAGYWYWHSNYYVFVLGPGGNLVRRLDIPEPYVFDRSGLVPDPDGNLWFLKWSRDGHTLYRIENTWSTPTTGGAETSETTAQIAQSGPPQARLSVPEQLAGTPVGLRGTATAGSPILGHVASTAQVAVLDQTEPERIDILTAPWYRVATADGTEGWVYGIFLEMEE